MKKSWYRELFEDEKHILSSKRILGTICVMLICIITIYVVFFPNSNEPPEFIITTLSTLAFGLLGLSTVDKFTQKNTTQAPVDNSTNNSTNNSTINSTTQSTPTETITNQDEILDP